MTSQVLEEKPQAASQCGSWDRNDPIQQEVSRGLKDMKKDIMGIVSLGKDGILRSLTADRRVLAAMPMTPERIEAFAKRLGEDYVKSIGGLSDADGSKTPKEKWFHPDEGVLPEPLAQERIDETKTWSEEQKEKLREHMRTHPDMVDVDRVLG
ncbi:hypothetical protein NX059_012075 [Plenodomus lindquistii]|nr:hypothetical protein NX059_012075 [Plenodomus lindquistii]